MIPGKWLLLAGALALGAATAVLAPRLLDSGESDAAASVEMRSAQFWAASLPDLAHQRQPLTQWLGKVVVVNFWAPWCPPCRNEIPGFIALQDQHGAAGLQFIGVALDEHDKVAAFVESEGINYPTLLGGGEAVELGRIAGNRLGGLPYTVVFDRKGNAVAGLTGEVSRERMEALVQPLL
ncbi:MAG: TlpA disulfide reductase family protein [Pseudomonadota bacterium]|nr:TlpA disulfide reductase family protein [Pseudomonadota bacterium]MDP1904715.1 TlpA disulfide reductase family protein [Pseudomonadota bacterium]MDP2353616.1 TlpA disulfide reductase family protein [Pseudomonadota bacterium]